MQEFEINGIKYRIGKLDAFKQFHVTRKIAPIVPTLIPMYARIVKNGGAIKDDLETLSELIMPFADAMANLSDEASEYIIETCLSVCQRAQADGTTWSPVWNKAGKVCMYDDIDLGGIMQIVIKVAQDSLGPFIQGLLTSQAGNPTAT